MGKGIALQASERFPGLSQHLGHLLEEYGNRVFRIGLKNDKTLITFPTKPNNTIVDTHEIAEDLVCRHMIDRCHYPGIVPGWAMKSQPSLIQQSVQQMIDIVNKYEIQSVVMPLPGCSNGELDSATVLPILAPLDDRFTIIRYKITG